MKLLRLLLTVILCAISFMAYSQNIGVFYDSNVPQIKFAAEDIKTTLEAKKIKVEMLPLSSLNAKYANKKVVLALATDKIATALLISQGGKLPTNVKEQGYALCTTSQPQTTYWVLGGDASGTMYGGFEIAENISFNAFTGVYNSQEAPAIPRRGIKLNLALDSESPTYGSKTATSKIEGIPNVWDFNFWTTWFDEMARNRYNVISVWNNHPFPSFVKVSGYEDVAIQDVTGIGKNPFTKKMSIDEKIVFWKKVMNYAHSRGFEFYLFNWNLFLNNAHGKYGIDEGPGKVTNQKNIDYMRKSMETLWETYPELDGFGITQGENMSKDDHADALFLAKTYGAGTLDYAKKNPNRKIRLVHRWHLADFTEIKANFGELMALPNINFQMSFKYSLAHMYSIAVPQRMKESHVGPLVDAGLRSFLTVRNDDFFYHNWGDPEFARTYVNGMIDRGDWFAGFYMGSDSYSPTRTFFSKNSVSQGMLEVQRQWYMNMLWGRLSYNPNTSDAVFKNSMAQKFPTVSSEKLFTSWQKASRCFTSLGELICGTLGRDNQWWPEACQAINADQTVGKVSPFLTIADFAEAKPSVGSDFISIAGTAVGNVKGSKNAFTIADEIETDAMASLSFVKDIKVDANTELGVTINNIKSMSYLSMYYSHKIRAAIYSKQSNKKNEAKEALGQAYCWWMLYSNLMDANFTGIELARSANLPNWHHNDASVLKEYTDQGGVGIPVFTK